MKELQARKQALAAECEVYRHAMTLEIQNLRLYTAHTRHRILGITSHPLVRLLPLVVALFGARFARPARPRKFSLLRTVFLGWRLYRKFGPAVRNMIALRAAQKVAREEAEATAPAANI